MTENDENGLGGWQTCDMAPSDMESQKPRQIAVKPFLEGRLSMDQTLARQILNRDDLKLIPTWLKDEARNVLQRGKYWVKYER